MATEILRPDEAGSSTEFSQYPDSTYHWDKVDEVTADDDLTRVEDANLFGGYHADLYGISEPTFPDSATINEVIVYIYARRFDANHFNVFLGVRSVNVENWGSPFVLAADYTLYHRHFTTDPYTGAPWTKLALHNLQVGMRIAATASAGGIVCTQIYVEVNYSLIVAPTVTTQAASSVEATSCTGNGTIVDAGGVNCTRRGFCYKVGTSGDPTTADSVAYDDGSFGTGAYTKGLTGLTPGTSYRVRAYAVNSAGTGYGTTVQILTKPAAPTNVSATDGVHTDKVVVTWTKSTGATGYQVYRDGVGLGWLGDVATYDDTGAGAPSITPGAAAASDGLYVEKVALSLSGQSTSPGTTHTYKVRAKNATGESADSSINTGYRGVGTLTYQWQRSAADSNADYSDISGATTASYNDTGAPADGSGRYYRCVENATGAAQQTSTSNRGYRATYYASGYIGDVIDCTALVDTYSRLEWTEELDSQNIEVKIRSSLDQATWSTWETIYSSPCTSFSTPVKRYLEWRATLSSDTTATPKLKDLTFNWTKKVE